MDRMRTQQILINLVQNAIKYNHSKGKVEISISATNSHESDYLNVVISVRDYGLGIPPEKRALLFLPF
jgi:signal transduction histidine kinase